jgi:hypothetical protein
MVDNITVRKAGNNEHNIDKYHCFTKKEVLFFQAF